MISPFFMVKPPNLDGEPHHDPFPSASHSTKSFESHRNHIELHLFKAFSQHFPGIYHGLSKVQLEISPRRCGHGWLRLWRYGGTTAARQGSRLVDRLDINDISIYIYIWKIYIIIIYIYRYRYIYHQPYFSIYCISHTLVGGRPI